LPALWGIWAYYVVRSDHAQALGLVTRCLALAENSLPGTPEVAAAISGAQYAYLGRWEEAERELRLATGAAGPTAALFPQDPALASRAFLAVVLTVRGDATAGRQELERAVAGAAALTGRQADFTRAYVFAFAAWCAELAGDTPQALSFGQQAIAVAQRNNFETWLGAGALHVAIALTELGDFANGLPLFEQALAGWQRAGAALSLPYFLGRYGRALVRAGRVPEGLAALRRALAQSETTGEHFYDAELHRFHAEAMTAAGASAADAARELDAARRVAGEQGAMTFERAAASE